jgi:lipoate-protein ligase A
MMDVMCWSAPSAAENLALDVELAKSAVSTGRSLLRFWWGDGLAVVMGSSERADAVVDTDACAALRVPILKRCSGGGTVLQTSGVLNYSLISPAPSTLDVRAAFRQGTDVIRAILRSFGVVGVACGTSDVAVGDRKISGNAQAWRWKSLLVHGTLLIDFDFDLAGKTLKHPSRQPDYRRGRSHRDFLITLRQLGISASRDEVEQAAVHAGEQIYGRVNRYVTEEPWFHSGSATTLLCDHSSATETYRLQSSESFPCS